MPLFSGVFNNPDEVIKEQRDEIKALKKRDLQIEKIEDGWREQVRGLERQNADLHYQMSEARARHMSEMEDLESRSQREIDEAKEHFRVVFETKIEDERSKLKAASRKEVETLTAQLAEAKGRIAGADARVSGAEGVVKFAKDQVLLLASMFERLTGQLPKVDLSKFNIDVTVPETNVVIKDYNKGK